MFLKTHHAGLERLLLDPSVEDRRLDFGCLLRIGEKVVAQFNYFPPELVRLAGALNIGIELSLYSASE